MRSRSPPISFLIIWAPVVVRGCGGALSAGSKGGGCLGREQGGERMKGGIWGKGERGQGCPAPNLRANDYVGAPAALRSWIPLAKACAPATPLCPGPMHDTKSLHCPRPCFLICPEGAGAEKVLGSERHYRQ